MAFSLEFRLLLEAGDVKGLMAGWAKACPQLPQPKDLAEAEITMHMARTLANSVSDGKRFYSHRWLLERGLPSQLPDHLKPRAERVGKGKEVEAVGISVNFKSPHLKKAGIEVRRSMEDVVNDMYANGDNKDPALVKQRMLEAREKSMHQLFGSVTLPK